MDLDLIGAQSVHPGHEPGQGGLPWSADPYQQHMTLRLSEYSVNSQHMVEDFVKQHKGHIQFFLIENLEIQAYKEM